MTDFMTDLELLKEVAQRYIRLKGEMDSYKPQVDADNKEAKRIMSTMGVKEVPLEDGYTLVYQVSTSDNFDEELLLDKLNHMCYSATPDGPKNISVGSGLGIIKYKPYVDMEALEDAIYKGLIDPTELASCRVKTETPKLVIKKPKKGAK